MSSDQDENQESCACGIQDMQNQDQEEHWSSKHKLLRMPVPAIMQTQTMASIRKGQI